MFVYKFILSRFSLPCDVEHVRDPWRVDLPKLSGREKHRKRLRVFQYHVVPPLLIICSLSLSYSVHCDSTRKLVHGQFLKFVQSRAYHHFPRSLTLSRASLPPLQGELVSRSLILMWQRDEKEILVL
jgi:hypothetical protein